MGKIWKKREIGGGVCEGPKKRELVFERSLTVEFVMLTFKNIFVYTKFVATLMSDHNTFPSDLRSCQTYYVQTYRNSYKILCYFSGVY